MAKGEKVKVTLGYYAGRFGTVVGEQFGYVLVQMRRPEWGVMQFLPHEIEATKS